MMGGKKRNISICYYGLLQHRAEIKLQPISETTSFVFFLDDYRLSALEALCDYALYKSTFKLHLHYIRVLCALYVACADLTLNN